MFLKFADWLVYDVFNMTASNLTDSIHFFIYDSLKILFLLSLIIFLISFLRGFLDNTKVKEQIEKQPKFIGYILAALLGAVTPFCSCSSVPLFIGFIEAGIPFGISMAYLITSPMINEIAVLLLAGVLGIKVTLIYVLTGISVGIAGGFLMEKLGFQKYLQDYLLQINKYKNSSVGCSCQKSNDRTLKNNLLNAFAYVKDLVSKIYPYVLLGVGFGAVLHGYVPTEIISKYLGSKNIFAVPFAVVFGIPLYSDVTTLVPIAEVLIKKGASIGTVLVFMMATSALSLPELIILSKVMKKELIIRFVSFMFVIFVLVGYFYNFIL